MNTLNTRLLMHYNHAARLVISPQRMVMKWKRDQSGIKSGESAVPPTEMNGL